MPTDPCPVCGREQAPYDPKAQADVTCSGHGVVCYRLGFERERTERVKMEAERNTVAGLATDQIDALRAQLAEDQSVRKREHAAWIAVNDALADAGVRGSVVPMDYAPAIRQLMAERDSAQAALRDTQAGAAAMREALDRLVASFISAPVDHLHNGRRVVFPADFASEWEAGKRVLATGAGAEFAARHARAVAALRRAVSAMTGTGRLFPGSLHADDEHCDCAYCEARAVLDAEAKS